MNREAETWPQKAMKQQRWEEQLKKQELLLWIEYALSTKTSDQARTEVRWRARQEASLVPQVWTCGHSEINVLYWRKYLLHFWDFSAPPQWFGALGFLPPLVTPLSQRYCVSLRTLCVWPNPYYPHCVFGPFLYFRHCVSGSSWL